MPTNEECADILNEISRVETDVHTHLQGLQTSLDKQHVIMQTHISHFKTHEEMERINHAESTEAQKANTAAINHLVTQMQIQSEDAAKDRKASEDVINAWNNAIMFIKGIAWFRNGVLWVCATIVGIGGVYTLGSTIGWWQ